MGEHRTALEKDLDRIRAKMSRRLMKALREGKLQQALKEIDREGKAFMKESRNGSRNGRSNGKKRSRK